jgi:hypothetical protein
MREREGKKKVGQRETGSTLVNATKLELKLKYERERERERCYLGLSGGSTITVLLIGDDDDAYSEKHEEG